MPSVYTIKGPSRRKKKGRKKKRRSGGNGKLTNKCRRVPFGGRPGCTIVQCRTTKGRWSFKKGTMRCD